MRRICVFALVVFHCAAAAALADDPAAVTAPDAHGSELSFTLAECIDQALNNNSELLLRLNTLNSIEGDDLIDRARFFNHFDVLGDFRRSRGTMTKTSYPNLSPATGTGLGAYDVTGFNVGDLDLGAMDLGGIDVAGLAAQYGVDLGAIDLGGIDLTAFFGRRGMSVPRDAAVDVDGDGNDNTLAEIIQYYLDPTFPMTEEEFQQHLAQYFAETLEQSFDPTAILDPLLEAVEEFSETLENAAAALDAFGELGATASRSPKVSSELSIRFSRRILEFGRDPGSTVAIRTRRRRAINDYEAKMREVIYNVRRTFFVILLKGEQIQTRSQLLADFEEKHRKLEERFNTAQDILMIDVLTAELDVLNEQLNVNILEKDLIKAKMDLMKLIGMPVNTAFELDGDLEEFAFTEEEVVGLALGNSFQIEYMRYEIEEQRRQIREGAWDYRPRFTARAGWENKSTSMALALNNAASTYGVDVQVEQYLNKPGDSTSIMLSNTGRENYSISLGVVYPLYDGTRRRGIKLKEETALADLYTRFADQRRVEELNARRAYQTLLEAMERARIQEERVAISRRRLEITQILREKARATEVQLETYRNRFFADQDGLFRDQENIINAQENLRRIMGVFY